MIVDYLSNAFTPDRRAVWDDAIAGAGLSIRVRRDDNDGFSEPAAMVARMDELGVDTLLLPAVDVGADVIPASSTFEAVASTWPEVEKLATRWPGRFAALAVVDPTRGMAGVRDARARAREPWVAGSYLHTHSWDRRLDHADYYPYYALASELDMPIAMQTGASGGLMASECGRAITVDRAALYFPETRFVLSHTGWPWVDEAIAMASKFSNVFLGTASFPPRHWPAGMVEFLRGSGRAKVMFGTNFPTVGHRQALAQLPDLDLDPAIEVALLGGNARRVFTRVAANGGARS